MSSVSSLHLPDYYCYRLATMAAEYCHLIDGFAGFEKDRSWLPKMSRLLPRLHVAVIGLSPANAQCRHYCFPDDDKRCELYMHLHYVMDKDEGLSSSETVAGCGRLCDNLADDLTDMYFDLKDGLELYEDDPQQAARVWLNSFYQHWGIHLLDAENWLHVVEAEAQPA